MRRAGAWLAMAATVCVAHAEPRGVTAVCRGVGACKAISGLQPVAGGAAFATFDDTLNSTGWTSLEVKAGASVDAAVQYYAAGFAEGYISADRIAQHYRNFMLYAFPDSRGAVSSPVRDFVLENDKWAVQQAAASGPADAYWATVGHVYQQLAGLVDGYAASPVAAAQPIDRLGFLLLNMQGDLSDVKVKVAPDRDLGFRYGVDGMPASAADAEAIEALTTHCSSMVRPLRDPATGATALHATHTMWWSYYSLIRVAKTYHLAKSVTLSSYPATITSTDDFYVLSSGLTVMETTNAVYNRTLYQHTHAQGQLMSWVRVMVAHMAATSGQEWTDLASRHNSGTYNNQWIVVDMARYERAGKQLVAGTLWVAEQMPGRWEAEDVTHLLAQRGFWPSYNRAFFPSIFNYSGCADMEAKFGDYYSYSQCPRALIFARDAPSVATPDDLRRFIRYNRWQQDPLALGCPSNQIAARSDLKGSNASCTVFANGATDAKLTDSQRRAPALAAAMVAGPTHDDQPPFQWSTALPEVQAMAHEGQPDLFDFDWVEYAPRMKATYAL